MFPKDKTASAVGPIGSTETTAPSGPEQVSVSKLSPGYGPTGGASSATKPAPRRKKAPGSTLDVQPGKRVMNGYPVTRDELFELGGVSFLATSSFSVGGSFVGMSYGIQSNLELAQGVPERLISRWQTREADYFWFGMALIILGIVAVVFGGFKVWSIIDSTEHET